MELGGEVPKEEELSKLGELQREAIEEFNFSSEESQV